MMHMHLAINLIGGVSIGAIVANDVTNASLITTTGIVMVAAITAFSNVKLHATVKKIDKAVNNAETGMPTLAQRVIDQDQRSMDEAEDLRLFRQWQSHMLANIGQKLQVETPPLPYVEKVAVAIPDAPPEITP